VSFQLANVGISSPRHIINLRFTSSITFYPAAVYSRFPVFLFCSMIYLNGSFFVKIVSSILFSSCFRMYEYYPSRISYSLLQVSLSSTRVSSIPSPSLSSMWLPVTTSSSQTPSIEDQLNFISFFPQSFTVRVSKALVISLSLRFRSTSSLGSLVSRINQTYKTVSLSLQVTFPNFSNPVLLPFHCLITYGTLSHSTILLATVEVFQSWTLYSLSPKVSSIILMVLQLSFLI